MNSTSEVALGHSKLVANDQGDYHRQLGHPIVAVDDLEYCHRQLGHPIAVVGDLECLLRLLVSATLVEADRVSLQCLNGQRCWR